MPSPEKTRSWAAFHEAGTVTLPDGTVLEAKQPALVMLRNGRIYAADPGRKRKILDVVLGRPEVPAFVSAGSGGRPYGIRSGRAVIMAEDGNTGIAKVAVFFLTAWFVAFLFGSLGEAFLRRGWGDMFRLLPLLTRLAVNGGYSGIMIFFTVAWVTAWLILDRRGSVSACRILLAAAVSAEAAALFVFFLCIVRIIL